MCVRPATTILNDISHNDFPSHLILSVVAEFHSLLVDTLRLYNFAHSD